jgi:GT2 family glycosyltransferase
MNLGSRISHCYYDTSVTRRLVPASKAVVTDNRWTQVIRMAFEKTPAVEEKITTDHQLEASGAAAFRREGFDRVGLFNESYARAEDSELTARLKVLGILVYYCPHPRVRHQYDCIPLDTLCKCFLTGYSRFRYYQKHPPASVRDHGVVTQLIMMKLVAIVGALRRARQAETVLGFLFYLPFMLLFEAANKVGFVCGWIASHKRTAGAGTPACSPELIEQIAKRSPSGRG